MIPRRTSATCNTWVYLKNFKKWRVDEEKQEDVENAAELENVARDVKDEGEIKNLVKEAKIINAVGEKSIEFLRKLGLIEKVSFVKKIPYAQISYL